MGKWIKTKANDEHAHKVEAFNHVTNWFYWVGCGCNSRPDAPIGNTFTSSGYVSRKPRDGKWGR